MSISPKKYYRAMATLEEIKDSLGLPESASDQDILSALEGLSGEAVSPAPVTDSQPAPQRRWLNAAKTLPDESDADDFGCVVVHPIIHGQVTRPEIVEWEEVPRLLDMFDEVFWQPTGLSK